MKKLFLTLMLCISFAVSAGESCIPKNDLRIPVSYSKSINGVDEAEFNKAIDDIEKLYAPIIKDKYNAELKVERRWDDETVNAYAQQFGSTWQVSMFGGLARHKLITIDGFRAVVCHEIGHHIGGAPRKGSWASNEGQSDYWATSHCLKRFFEEVDHEETIKVYKSAGHDADSKFAKEHCDKAHSSLLESAVCFRGAMAGQSLANLLGELGNAQQALSFSTPDKKEVTRTDHNHPQAQCRMDTYFNGALCDKEAAMLTDSKDVSVAFCTEKEKYKVGVRPHCWYKPSEYEK